MDRTIKVILLLDLSSEFDRKLLRGIMRYSQEHGPWQFYRMPAYFSRYAHVEQLILEWARKWEADGIIGKWNSPQTPLLQCLGIPVIRQNYQTRSEVYSRITGDYIGAGRMAAQFFQRRHFRHYAYFGLKDVIWSMERRQGFAEELGQDIYAFEAADDDVQSNQGIARWLHELPKPAAIFCCDDAHAFILSETCKLEGIPVPEDVALLGVDNDEFYCSIADPPISSIALNEEQGGYRLAGLMHRQILEGTKEPFTVTIPPRCIIERTSTDRHNIQDPYVAAVVRYIADHYREELNAELIAAQVPLSKRSVELRFKKTMGTSIYQYLTQQRIEHFTRLLVTTDRGMLDMAMEAGFKDAGNIARIFHKYKGCSPKEYRQRFSFFEY